MSAAIYRVQLKNYRSIARCDVRLGSLTILVGPNGAGKSNFVDALRLVADALSGSLEQALRNRGGVEQVRRRSNGHPTHFSISLDMRLSDERWAHYGFKVGAEKDFRFRVQEESCRIENIFGGDEVASYLVKDGQVVEASPRLYAQVESDRLYLTTVSGLPGFRAVWTLLKGMGFYQLQPDQIGKAQEPDVGDHLLSSGENLASVLRQMARRDEGRLSQVQEYLRAIVPGVTEVFSKAQGTTEQVTFKQLVNAEYPWEFPGTSMSDGTLRALGVLVAALQPLPPMGPTLVSIEEPEVAIHPGMVPALAEALAEASISRQIVLTTHSPDLLDQGAIQRNHLRAVSSVRGATRIAQVDAATRAALQDDLYSPGELLRMGQIEPDVEAIPSEDQQLSISESTPPGEEG
ncbi:MAG: AAA family ATPase [Alphaproteobacteria bacterium]|nr:AAA family ATPase [Alphaproteobacteria bacterium]